MEEMNHLKAIMKYRPSIIRNTFLIFIVRFVALFLSFGLMSFGIYILSESSNLLLEETSLRIFIKEKWMLAAFCFAGAILCYFIRYLGRLLMERNDFIAIIEEFADSFPENKNQTPDQ